MGPRPATPGAGRLAERTISLERQGLASVRSYDGSDTTVTGEIAVQIEKAKPGDQQPQRCQQPTEHELNPMHYHFDVAQCKVLLKTALSPRDTPACSERHKI